MDRDIDVCSIKNRDCNEIRLRIKIYNAQKYVDIRNFCKAENSDAMFPTKRGVMIHVDDFQAFAKGLQSVAIKLSEIDKLGKEVC